MAKLIAAFRSVCGQGAEAARGKSRGGRPALGILALAAAAVGTAIALGGFLSRPATSRDGATSLPPAIVVAPSLGRLGRSVEHHALLGAAPALAPGFSCPT